MPDIIITPSSGIIDFFPVSTRVGRIDGSGNSLNITNPSGYVILSSSGLSVNSSSPNATLFAYSATSGATLLNVEGTNGSLFSVVDNLSGTLMSVNNNAGLPVFEVFSDDRVVAGRFGQSDFVMTSGGNVGIGTGVPSSKFHVVGTSTFNGDVSSTGSFIAGSGSAALPSFEFINDVDTGLFSPAANTLGVSTSGVERLRINNVGNVGIGLDSPVEKLDVLGNVKIAGANISLTIAQDDTTTMRMRSAGNLIVGAGSAANVRFLISTTEHARLSDQGRFGIGLVSPSGKLGVAGGATIGSNYNITPPTNGLIVEGNVGIGTTTPTSQLHVIGTGIISSRLGINTNSPSVALEVNGSIKASGIQVLSGGEYLNISVDGHGHESSDISTGLGNDFGWIDSFVDAVASAGYGYAMETLFGGQTAVDCVSENIPDRVVRRDSNGDFSTTNIYATGIIANSGNFTSLNVNGSGVGLYDTSILSLGSISGTNSINCGQNRQIQTLTLNGTATTFTKGSGWPTSNSVSRDVTLNITCSGNTSVTWSVVNDWYRQPDSPLPSGKHNVLLRAIGSGTIEGHYIGNKTN